MTTSARSPWRRRLSGLLPERARRARDAKGSRGAAEVSVLVVAGSLVAGVFFGQGISGTAVDVADGLTWLSDEPNGQIIQVNPATGKLEVKQRIGNPGDDLEITGERDGQLYVIDHTSGRLLAFDLSSILVSGQRRVSDGAVVDTVWNDDGVFLVDSEKSTISAIDPITMEAIGTIWVAPSGLADVAVDGEGDVWALEDDGTVNKMSWSNDELAFSVDDDSEIDSSGPESVLVAHDRGVTVFAPEEGRVTQVGTGSDVSGDAPKVIGDLYAPERAPRDLVPVAAADNGFVTIVTDDDAPRAVDMQSIACNEPGTPEVFRGLVYVPCLGEGRVVRLTSEGQRGGEDILTPGSADPELVLDDDNLIVNAPGAAQGVVVHDDGSLSTVVREDPDLPVNDLVEVPEMPTPTPPEEDEDLIDDIIDDLPTITPPPSPDPTGPTTGPPPQVGRPCETSTSAPSSPTSTPTSGTSGREGRGRGKGKPDCDRGVTSPTQAPTTAPTSTPTDVPTGLPAEPEPDLRAPTGVVATLTGDGQAQITWSHDDDPEADAFELTSSAGGGVIRTLPGDVRTGFAPVVAGQAVTFTVTAVRDSERRASSPSNSVVDTSRPGAPATRADAAYAQVGNELQFNVSVSWDAAPDGGSPVTGYQVTVTVNGGQPQTQNLGPDARTAGATTRCDRAADPACVPGGPYTVTVVASNARGASDPGVVSRNDPPAAPAPTGPADGATIVVGHTPSPARADMDGNGSTTLQLAPPADWAGFPGRCYYIQDGYGEADVACNATSVPVSYSNGPRYAGQGAFSHTVTFYATGAHGRSTSAPYTFTTTQPIIRDNCGEIPAQAEPRESARTQSALPYCP